ncbi:MAG: tripartite tricarboxylate transporter TctB family protein [Deltaproteobacteria bacterium]|nr:tripartite tricarboxylate transporter TctB family protein [Deltaproteobacteria bacterium]
MFLGFGMLGIVLSFNYPMGSSRNMGPGYFPLLVSSILSVLGLVIVATSFKLDGKGLGSFAFRPMILLGAGFALFGLAIGRVGFIPAFLALIVVCAAAGREFRWKEVVIMTALLVAGCWAIFLWGLKLPIPIFCWRF